MKGILFKSWKSKAIAVSSPDFVWQTRRLYGLKEINKEPDGWKFIGTAFYNEIPLVRLFRFAHQNTDQIELQIKPYFQVNDIVYIKEAWAVNPTYDELKPSEIPHTAFVTYLNERYNELLIGRERSAMFMPEWAARYFIKITGVRYERLQDITEEDALAEGCNKEIISGIELPSAKRRYSYLWDSINPKHPWSNNDWVVVYSFVKQERPDEEKETIV